ncbi:hypothetical protein MAHJHV57_50050 [Mycobacterium avium subsp. hominissuis]
MRATVSIDLAGDPLTAGLSGRPAPELKDVVAVAKRAAGQVDRHRGALVGFDLVGQA